MTLDIKWEEAYKTIDNYSVVWKREWCIPPELLPGFFSYWKKNKYSLLNDGYSVKKNEKTKRWYLVESKSSISKFKNLSEDSQALPEEEYNPIILQEYSLKHLDVLRPWQLDAVKKLIPSINHWGAAIDGSDLGMGKSFSACGVMRELNLPFVIVAPKSVIHQWTKIIHQYFDFGDKFRGIINYELLIRGRKDSKIASFVLDRKTRRNKFTWKIPKNSIIIWDEAHRLKNYKTKASKSCIEAYKQGYRFLFLSATLASSPLDLRTIGICSKIFKGNATSYYEWAEKHGVYKGMWGLEFNGDQKALKKIHQYLFNERGVRLLRDSVPNFPQTEIIVNAYDLGDSETEEIKKIYNEMYLELKKLEKKEKSDESEMAIRIRALQKAEMLKVPLFEEMINEGIEAGMSVVVFMNYSDSIDALAKRFNTECVYDGRNERIRNKYIDLFQQNKEPLLITNLAAAREGLNLGDELGTRPRLSLISPTYSVTKLKQALGRVHRENSKTKSIQKILYIAKTQEENVVDSVGQKLQDLTLINNGEITDNDLKI